MHKDNKRSKVYKRIREKLNRIKRIKLKNLIKTKLCRFFIKAKWTSAALPTKGTQTISAIEY